VAANTSIATDRQGLQAAGRRLLTTLYAAMQALKLYPVDNDTVQRALDELDVTSKRLLQQEGVQELSCVNACFFLNQTRLRGDVSIQELFAALNRCLSQHEIGSLEIEAGASRDEWIPLLRILLSVGQRNNIRQMQEQLRQAKVKHLRIAGESNFSGDENDGKAAQRVYLRSAHVAREFMTAIQMGRAVNVRRVKRSVQTIVDQVLNNEFAILGMTTLREFDEYTYTHCVNVSILSIVLGRRLGLEKNELYELGMCGLLHDIGKMRVGAEIINKPGKLTREEWHQVTLHPREGLLSLFHIHGFVEIPYRQMLAAYEHHMKMDQSGYPVNKRPRQPTLFTRIVSVADTFDAVTSARSYRKRPWTPDKVLKNMRDEPNWGLDRTLVRAFINATGIYPVGTLVLLDDQSMAMVVSQNPQLPSKPGVKVIADATASPIEPPLELDLSQSARSGGPKILRSMDARNHEIDLAQYFL
jgi:HD-GYP domain-containing protein (c-di-GMP phosphodiesterase class II)